MRLSELEPELEVEPGGTVARLLFLCPHCRNAHIGIKLATWPQGPQVWEWNGVQDLEHLTVTPSINCHSHWHGFITDGEVLTA